MCRINRFNLMREEEKLQEAIRFITSEQDKYMQRKLPMTNVLFPIYKPC